MENEMENLKLINSFYCFLNIFFHSALGKTNVCRRVAKLVTFKTCVAPVHNNSFLKNQMKKTEDCKSI